MVRTHESLLSVQSASDNICSPAVVVRLSHRITGKLYFISMLKSVIFSWTMKELDTDSLLCERTFLQPFWRISNARPGNVVFGRWWSLPDNVKSLERKNIMMSPTILFCPASSVCLEARCWCCQLSRWRRPATSLHHCPPPPTRDLDPGTSCSQVWSVSQVPEGRVHLISLIPDCGMLDCRIKI